MHFHAKDSVPDSFDQSFSLIVRPPSGSGNSTWLVEYTLIEGGNEYLAGELHTSLRETMKGLYIYVMAKRITTRVFLDCMYHASAYWGAYAV